MVPPTGSDPELPENRSQQARGNQARAAQHRRPSDRNSAFVAQEETGFWAHLEEREFGRLAQEADHLFDTSYSWAA